MRILIGLAAGHRFIYKSNFQTTILRPFSSTCVKRNDTNINGVGGNQVEEIYQGPLSNQIRGVKLFSLLTSLGGLLVQPVVIQKASELHTHLAVVIGSSVFIGFFTFVTPLLLHLITKRYVRTIEYDSQTETYMAKTYTLFVRDKMVFFKAEDVIVPDVTGMFTSFHAKGIPLFVDPSKFNDVYHYKKIMGYDKPIDYKLSETKKDG